MMTKKEIIYSKKVRLCSWNATSTSVLRVSMVKSEELCYFWGEFLCVDFDHSVNVDKVELACAITVKARLRERLTF